MSASSTANVLTEAFTPALAQEIELYDNTLREGEQPPGVVFDAQTKLEIAHALDELGVHWANIGFAAVSVRERRTCERIAAAGLRMKLSALCRLRTSDIDATVDTGVDMVSMFIGGSDTHLHHKHGMSEAEALSAIEAGVRRAKDRGARYVSFMPEDGSRTPLERLLRMFEVAIEAGADYVGLADTVGVLTPSATARIIERLRGPKPLAIHFHDDLGLALANSLCALEAGAQLVHVTVNGVGERSGNTPLEELAVVLRVKYGRDIGLRLERLHALSQLVHRASGTRAPEHKAVTGRWAFTHESGIHVAGLLAEPETYQAFDPALVGRGHEVVFGKHSGSASIEYAAKRAGLPLTEEVKRTVLQRLKEASEREKAAVDEARVAAWIRGELEGWEVA